MKNKRTEEPCPPEEAYKMLAAWESKELRDVDGGRRHFTFHLNDNIRIVDHSMGPCITVADFDQKQLFIDMVRVYNRLQERVPEAYEEKKDVFPDIGMYCWRTKEYIFSRRHLFIVNSMLNFINESSKQVWGATRSTKSQMLQTDPENVDHSQFTSWGNKKKRTLRQK